MMKIIVNALKTCMNALKFKNCAVRKDLLFLSHYFHSEMGNLEKTEMGNLENPYHFKQCVLNEPVH